eukprot:TRINITY_DN42164_c0_g1_i1.p1 TRINITY_DN42164_c0_g1~~TRINITY_DN42164_c0_g1_i1.p1  ORF type:complete len:237 (-),score=35.68 TRINITY_DN42164_c0_g1_i1:6-716(-)
MTDSTLRHRFTSKEDRTEEQGWKGRTQEDEVLIEEASDPEDAFSGPHVAETVQEEEGHIDPEELQRLLGNTGMGFMDADYQEALRSNNVFEQSPQVSRRARGMGIGTGMGDMGIRLQQAQQQMQMLGLDGMDRPIPGMRGGHFPAPGVGQQPLPFRRPPSRRELTPAERRALEELGIGSVHGDPFWDEPSWWQQNRGKIFRWACICLLLFLLNVRRLTKMVELLAPTDANVTSGNL